VNCFSQSRPIYDFCINTWIADCAFVVAYCDDEPMFGLFESIVLHDHDIVKYLIVRRVETG
jgi:hypothetical protein